MMVELIEITESRQIVEVETRLRIKNTLDVELNLQVGQNMRGIPQLLQQINR